MAAVKTTRRETYKSFWDKYSDKPDNGAMMLNKNADEIEELDRYDILKSLPDFTNKDVVDIGAGIGRFTTIFSHTARHVTSTDFIDSFIAKNKERNAAAKNIKFVVSDAAHLHLPKRSTDLVFTNWLMMYMSDFEVVEFITNALKWIKPQGHLKLRESCSEPSTGKKNTASLHTADVNPTHYRYSSLYIQLLKHVQVQDEDGSWWKLDCKWSSSVPTYISKMSNWRQVHWLAQKVPASDSEPHMTFDELLANFSKTWKDEQHAVDSFLDDDTESWTNKILGQRLDISEDAAVLGYNPRNLDLFVKIDSHNIVQDKNLNLWTVEMNPYAYRTALTKATEKKDRRIRAGWNPSFSEAVDYLRENKAEFEAFVATELLASENVETIRNLPTVLAKNTKLFLLEPAGSELVLKEYLQKLEESGLSVLESQEVTSETIPAIQDYILRRNLDSHLFQKSLDSKWFFIAAQTN